MAVGWNNSSSGASGTEYTNLFPHSGEYTYSGDKLCGPIPNDCAQDKSYSYEIPLEGWSTDAEIVKAASTKSCNQEMLVTWFNGGNNLSYSSVLNNASIFTMKNIDECGHILVTKDPTKYPFITNLTQVFAKNGYEDSGYPKICSNPCNSGSYSCNVYQSGRRYAGHKIKYLPNSATIPENCLINNSNFVEIYFPHNYDSDNQGRTITTIGPSAFSGNTNLSAITFSAVVDIGNYAFYECHGLKRIDWGHKCCSTNSKIKTIGNYAFYGCTSIENLCLDQLFVAEKIGRYAFAGCGSLKKLTLPTSSAYVKIEESCFESCNKLGYVKIPNNIKEIESRAFYGLGRNMDSSNYPNVLISNSVETIGDRAFGGHLSNGMNVYVSWGWSSDTQNHIVLINSSGEAVSLAPNCFGGESTYLYVPRESDKNAYEQYISENGMQGITVSVGTLA